MKALFLFYKVGLIIHPSECFCSANEAMKGRIMENTDYDSKTQLEPVELCQVPGAMLSAAQSTSPSILPPSSPSIQLIPPPCSLLMSSTQNMAVSMVRICARSSCVRDIESSGIPRRAKAPSFPDCTYPEFCIWSEYTVDPRGWPVCPLGLHRPKFQCPCCSGHSSPPHPVLQGRGSPEFPRL